MKITIDSNQDAGHPLCDLIHNEITKILEHNYPDAKNIIWNVCFTTGDFE